MPPDALKLALALITRWEGFESEPYQDATGTWTIGYGFTEGITRTSPPMTREQALPLLTSKITSINTHLDIICLEPLSNHQRAACLSLAYNIGMGAFGRSTLLRYLNEGAYGAASAQFLMFTWSKHVQLAGLVKRREAEMTCFNTPDQTKP
jgi:lysozyme